ncbi:ATP-binding protein [Granulosicoccus sp. 3-233]|uniref:PAS domain-containing hybrid sensor histidine kinase/response regulator n=1 Tax=Granulosicoccus sp. 3-233 TaxID=3417969 RepID=UPI003D33F330
MTRIAVFDDCHESLIDALRSLGDISRISNRSSLHPSLHDVLIVDGRSQELEQATSSMPITRNVPVILIVNPHQNIPENLTSRHVTDLITPDEIGTRALAWRLDQIVRRFQSPLGLDTPKSPEIQLLHQVVDLLNDWVVIKDHEHRYLEVSESFAQTVGMAKDRIIGKNDLEVGIDREVVLGNPRTGWSGTWFQDDHAIQTGESTTNEELDWRAFAVNRRYKRVARRPLRNSQGNIYALLIVTTDITDRVLAERNLQARNLMLRQVTQEKLNADKHRQIAEQAIRAKNKFLVSASHDLRQPLHALGLFLAVLEGRLQDSDDRDVLQKIRHSSESLNALFNSLLDISRLDAGVVEVSLKTFSIRSLLNSIRDEFVQLGKTKSIPVSVELTDSIVHTDPVLFARIIRNLLQNAITHTLSGSVLLRSVERDGKLQIDVIDTGPGIPPQHHEEIFSEYFQLDNDQQKTTRGLGLGLAIVRKMAQLLDIDITLKSATNEGSTFTVTVPLGKSTDLNKSNTPSRFFRLAGMKILFIDDEPDIREGQQLILEAFDCQTLAAESTGQALSLLQEQDMQPDILVVDYQLKNELTGTAAINAVRAHFERRIPAIIVTGDTSKKRLREAQQTGCRLLHKPVDAKDLVKTIASVLEEELESS